MKHKKFAAYCSIFLMMLAVAAITEVQAKETFKGIPDFGGKFREHVVRSGEDLYSIARSLGYAIEHLSAANGLTGLSVPAGRTILIPSRRIPPVANMENGLVLNLPEKGIYLFKKGKFVKFFPVAIGQTGRWMTPTGDMKIVNMAKNPTWIPPEWAGTDTPVPAGPDNPLGDRWMGLDRPGFGIHATNNPSSIGLAASHGCVRMYPEMARDLFEQVYVGMPVKVVYEPVKLGYDPEKKQFCLEVYGDVYGLTPGLLKQAEKKLEDANLLGLVDMDTLRRIIERKRGIPEPVIGSDITVKIDGVRMKPAFPPLKYNNKIWVSSDVLDAIDAKLVWNKENKTIEVHRDGRKAVLKVGHSLAGNENTAYAWQGKSFVPLSYVLKHLGVRFSWYSKEEVVYISTEHPQKAAKVPVKTTKTGKTPTATPTPQASPTPDVTPSPSPSPTVEPTPVPTATPETPTPSPSVSPEPGPSPTPAGTPSPAPTGSPSPGSSET